jgi:hypothetical protein
MLAVFAEKERARLDAVLLVGPVPDIYGQIP